MSFHNISLPPLVVTELYGNTLIDTSESEYSSKIISREPGIHFLGNNLQKISIVVNNPRDTFISERQLSFLTKILTACNLTIADVAIINFGESQVSIMHIVQHLSPVKLWLLGIDRKELQLGIPLEDFQVKNSGSIKCLKSPSLEQMNIETEESKILKGRLWNCLKEFFPR